MKQLTILKAKESERWDPHKKVGPHNFTQHVAYSGGKFFQDKKTV